MRKDDVKKQVYYWLTVARHDRVTMLGLFKIKRYSDALFYGHLVLEKTLKALFVAHNEKSAPPIHDLGILIRKFDNGLTSDEINTLDKVNKFNIRARYPDERLNFYRICDKNYTFDYLKKINIIYNKLCLEKKLKK